MPTQSRKIFPRRKDPAAHPFRNPGEELNHPIDLLIVHQGVIDPDDPVTPEEVIVFSFFPDIVAKSESLEKIVKDIGAGRDNDVDQFHFDHIMDHFAHAARDHGSGQTEKDEAPRVSEHLSIGLKALIDVPTLKRGMSKGLNHLVEGMNLLKIQMLNRTTQKF